MTLRERITQASAKATGGVWEDQSTTGYISGGEDGRTDIAINVREDDQFLIVALVNAYRAGKLIVVEDEADAVRRMAEEMRRRDPLRFSDCATAALAALKGESA